MFCPNVKTEQTSQDCEEESALKIFLTTFVSCAQNNCEPKA